MIDIVSYDLIEYNALPYFGTIYYIYVPLLIIGIIIYTKNLVKIKKFNLENIIYIMFISNIIAMMCIDSPNINKTNGIFFSIIYFIIYGIYYIKNEKMIKLTQVILIINFIIFSSYYFGHYSYYDEAFFEIETYKIINENYEQIKDEKILIYNENIEKYIYEKLGKILKISTKEEIINLEEDKEFSDDSVCIVNEENYVKYKNKFKIHRKYEKNYLLHN